MVSIFPLRPFRHRTEIGEKVPVEIPKASLLALGINVAELVWAVETLESYNIANCDGVAASSITFSTIEMSTANGFVPDVLWSTAGSNQCGEAAHVTQDGASDGEIVIGL